MSVDLSAAAAFMAGHARLLDRRRFDLVAGGGDIAAVHAAVEAYRNPDGGYGSGLEPDLRVAGSQPISALHAFEAFEECGVATRRAVELCDWLATVALDDGGLPFVLPINDDTACAPWFAGADHDRSSLHGTLAVIGPAWRVARHDPAVAAHPWLEQATRYCLDAMGATERLSAYETMAALRLLDALPGTSDLAPLAATLPSSGALPVEGGVEGEALRPLDYSPEPGSPLRDHLDPALIEAELARLEAGQQADGGWEVDFPSFSPMAALEWRGYATVNAVKVLAAHGLIAGIRTPG